MTSVEPGGEAIRRAATYLVPSLVGYVMPVATLAVVTRFLGADEYGAYALAQVYAVLAAGVVNLGLPVVFERNYFAVADNPARVRLLYSILSFVVMTSVLGGLLTWRFADRLSTFVIGSPGFGILVLTMYSAVALGSIKVYYLIWLRNEGRAADYARFSVDETVLGGLIQMLCVAVLGMGVLGLPVGQLVASAAVLAVIFVKFWREARPAVAWPPLRESLRLALPLTPRVFIGAFEGQAGKWISGQLTSVGAAGVYGLGQRIAYGVFTVLTAIQGAYGPQLYKRLVRGGCEPASGVGTFLLPFAYASAAVALLAVLFAEEALWLLAPSEYGGAANVVMLLGAFYGVQFFGKVSGPQLMAARWPILTSALSIFSVAISLGGMTLLTPPLGATGTALGTLLAGLVAGALAVWAAQRVRPIDWRWTSMAAMYSLVVGAAIAFTLMLALGMPYAARASTKAVVLVLFVAVGRHLGMLSSATVPLIREAFSRRGTFMAADAPVVRDEAGFR